jgi:hypothetical protein
VYNALMVILFLRAESVCLALRTQAVLLEASVSAILDIQDKHQTIALPVLLAASKLYQGITIARRVRQGRREAELREVSSAVRRALSVQLEPFG